MATAFRPRPQVIPPDADEIESDIPNSSNALAVLNRSEVEMQMDFARENPRSIAQFRKRVLDRVTVNEDVAVQMTYSKPSSSGPIVGPSVRFAEVVASSWGNCIAMSRVVGEDGDYIVAQGIFFDVETNYKFGKEVRRRIIDKNGRRYQTDVIQSTGNAAASIAFRNAVFGGISKGDWADLHETAKQTAIGNAETLGARRSKAIQFANQMAITNEMIFAALEVKGIPDITGEHLVALRGWLAQIKNGDAKVDDIFGSKETNEAESLMDQLAWNAAKRDMNRSSYRGRATEQIEYLRGELGKKQKADGDKAVAEGAAAPKGEAKAETKPETKATEETKAETQGETKQAALETKQEPTKPAAAKKEEW